MKAHDGFESLSYGLFSIIGDASDTILKQATKGLLFYRSIKYKAILTPTILEHWLSMDLRRVEPSAGTLTGSVLGVSFILSWPNAGYMPNGLPVCIWEHLLPEGPLVSVSASRLLLYGRVSACEAGS